MFALNKIPEAQYVSRGKGAFRAEVQLESFVSSDQRKTKEILFKSRCQLLVPAMLRKVSNVLLINSQALSGFHLKKT